MRAGGRDGTGDIEGSTRGPRGPKKGDWTVGGCNPDGATQNVKIYPKKFVDKYCAKNFSTNFSQYFLLSGYYLVCRPPIC